MVEFHTGFLVWGGGRSLWGTATASWMSLQHKKQRIYKFGGGRKFRLGGGGDNSRAPPMYMYITCLDGHELRVDHHTIICTCSTGRDPSSWRHRCAITRPVSAQLLYSFQQALQVRDIHVTCTCACTYTCVETPGNVIWYSYTYNHP